ncbi:hypothetical protein FJZ19_05980 [Candidatus Pacearchaeota archaeon]|nr:hypothetical protein [Candidatus Pacearchaeota archaeon]
MLLYAGSDLLQIVITCLIVFIASSILSIFSPFGIGFAVFSIIRAKTQNSNLRKACLVFQIILPILTLIVGMLIAILFFMTSYHGYFSTETLFIPLLVFFGVLFVVCIEIGVFFWENSLLRNQA